MPRSVEILKDSRGTFGLQLNTKEPIVVLFRPDYLKKSTYKNNEYTTEKCNYFNLKMHGIPKKNKKLKGTFEEGRLVNLVVDELRYKEVGSRYTSLNDVPDYKDAKKNNKELAKQIRQKWHGLESLVKKEFNYALAACLKDENCADQNALRIARRFPNYRGQIYLECCRSERVAQFFETFPFLAYHLYIPYSTYLRYDSNIIKARQMVESGDKLKYISEVVDVPLILRKIKPNNVGLIATKNFAMSLESNSKMVHAFMPWQTMYQMRWLILFRDIIVDFRHLNIQDIFYWFVRNIPYKMKTINMLTEYNNLRDWLVYISRYANNVARPIKFSKNMSFESAKEASAHWHAMIPFRRSGLDENLTFPEPWLPEETIGKYTIKPIINGKDLYIEGKEMKHCVSMYAPKIVKGASYIYSIEKDGKKAATLELRNIEESWPHIMNTENKVLKIAQLRSHCNAEPPKELKNVVYNWFEKNKSKAKLPELSSKENINEVDYLAQQIDEIAV